MPSSNRGPVYTVDEAVDFKKAMDASVGDLLEINGY